MGKSLFSFLCFLLSLSISAAAAFRQDSRFANGIALASGSSYPIKFTAKNGLRAIKKENLVVVLNLPKKITEADLYDMSVEFDSQNPNRKGSLRLWVTSEKDSTLTRVDLPFIRAFRWHKEVAYLAKSNKQLFGSTQPVHLKKLAIFSDRKIRNISIRAGKDQTVASISPLILYSPDAHKVSANDDLHFKM